MGKMEASARCEIDLLGERRIDTQIDEKLTAEDLLSLAASHLKLREKEYFGLSYKDEDGHLHWLQPDKLVLDQVTETCIQQQTNGDAKIVLHFMVKYYVPTIALLNDAATVEAFFMQAKLLMSKGVLEPDSHTEYRLTALALQANFGDWTRDDDARLRLRQGGFYSSSLTKQISVDYCERKIIEEYRNLLGYTRGNAIIQYMNTVEGLATYGIHFYKVQQKDKNGPTMWIGLSHRGLSEYDLNNRKVPKKFYQWKYMENIYYRETKFSIEINNPKSSTSTLSGNAAVIVWFAANAALNKTIWSMAIAQHQFHMDHRRSRKQTPEDFLKLQRISTELNNPKQMTIRSSLSRIALAFEGKDDDKATPEIKLSRLSGKKSALVEILRKKLKELQELCKKEAEITGVLDRDAPNDNDIANPTLRKAKPLIDRNANEIPVPTMVPQKPPPPPPQSNHHRTRPPPLPPSHSLDRMKARSPIVDHNENVDSVDGLDHRPRANTLGRDFGRNSSCALRPSPRSSLSSTSSSPVPPPSLGAYSAPSSPRLNSHFEAKRYVPSIAQQSTHTAYRRSQYPSTVTAHYRSSSRVGEQQIMGPPMTTSPPPSVKMRAPSPLLEASRIRHDAALERVNLYSVKTQRLSQAFSSHDNIPSLLQQPSASLSDVDSINTLGLPSPPKDAPPLPPPPSRPMLSSVSSSSLMVPGAPPPGPPPQPKPKKEWVETSLDDPLPMRRSPVNYPSPPSREIQENVPPHPPREPPPSRLRQVESPPAIPAREPQATPSTVVRTQSSSTQVVVEAGKFKPYYEESKPYETSDFYKYSTRHRKS